MPSRQVTIQGILTWEGPEGPVDPGWGNRPGGRPDNSLPIPPFYPTGGPIYPGGPTDPGFGGGRPGGPDPGYGVGGGFRPDNSLPGGGYPSHGLPGGGYPSQGLPWGPGRPDNALPGAGGGTRPDNSLPGANLSPAPTPPEPEEYNWYQTPNGWVVGAPKSAEPKPE